MNSRAPRSALVRPLTRHSSTKKNTFTKKPIVKNTGSTQIMRRAGFAGKLHRGHVVDAATDTLTACDLKAQCGACAFVNTNYGESLLTKFNDSISLIKQSGVLDHAQILNPIASPTPLGYRSYFKLAVRPATFAQKAQAEREGNPKRFAIGLFEPGTHRVGVDMRQCPIHTKPLANLIASLTDDIENTAVEPWDEVTGEGCLRYIAARSAHLTGEIMITFVVAQPKKNELIKLVNRLRHQGHKINSAHMNINTSAGNAIFGDDTVLLAGSQNLRERVCDLDIEVSPLAFFQNNPWQANQLYRRVEMHAGKGSNGDVAWDLYTGTGQMALLLARSGYQALGVEEVSAAVKDASRNAMRNQLSDSATFIASRVEDSEILIPSWAQNPKIIVVNPSRRGLHDGARAHLAHVLQTKGPTKFIYVSCDVQTLARDLKTLTATGYRVRQLEAFDMFAQTDKLEWIAVLTK